LGILVEPQLGSLQSDGGDGGSGAVDHEVNGDLKQGVDESETLLGCSAFFVVLVKIVAGGYQSTVGWIHFFFKLFVSIFLNWFCIKSQ